MDKQDLRKIDQQIGRNLRALRTRRGMAQQELACRAGVTFQQVQKYERGSNRIAGSRMHHLAQLLGVQPQALFEGCDGDSETAQDPTVANRACRKLTRKLEGLGNDRIEKALCGLVDAMLRDSPAIDAESR